MPWIAPSRTKPDILPVPDTRGRFATRSNLRSVALATLLAALVLFPLLGHRPLTDWDEGIYAEIAREMISGSWLTPHWNGQPWFEKPPLAIWLTGLSMHLFGLNAWAARLPSALAGVGTVSLLHAWLRQRLGGASAWFSTVVLLSGFGFQHAARVGEMDVLLGLGCLLGAIGLADVSEGRQRAWWLFWSGFAIAVMTKGAASVALPLTAALLLLLDRAVRRQPNPRFGAHFWTGSLAFLAAVAPWHVWMYAHFGHVFLDEYLGYQVMQRSLAGVQGHHTHAWFYLWVLLVSAPPFALLYPWAAAAPFRSPELRVLRSLSIFAVVSLGLFTVARTRVPHYMVPSYAAFSGLTGALLSHWWQHRSFQPRTVLKSLTGIQAAGAGALLYAVAALLTASPRRALHSPHFAEGYTTPDNREPTALLQRTVGQTQAVPGPLLIWVSGLAVPITTDAFYAQRLAQQVNVGPMDTTEPRDLYYRSPEPLDRMLPPGGQRLILLEKSLAPELHARYDLTPLATGRSYEVALVQAK